MRGLRIALGFVGVFGLAATAVAAEPGFYIGGGVGQYDAQVDHPLSDAGIACLVSPSGPDACARNYQDSAAAWDVMAGFQIWNWLAIQADYEWYEKGESQIPINSSRNLSVSGEAAEVSLKPSLPLGEHFELYARVGWTWYTLDAKYQFVKGQSNSDDAAMVAGGVGFNFTPAFSIQAEYEYVDVNAGALDAVTVRGVYRFQH
jgi:opacity protein-like surface antigen